VARAVCAAAVAVPAARTCDVNATRVAVLPAISACAVDVAWIAAWTTTAKLVASATAPAVPVAAASRRVGVGVVGVLEASAVALARATAVLVA
jgi:hypothetical protein